MKLRKVAATAVSLLALGALLAGCAQGSSPAAAPKVKTLNLWMPPQATGKITDQQFWDSEMKGFTKETGVKVKTTIVPWADYETKFLTGIASGDGPDVAYSYSALIVDYLAKHQLVPYDQYLTAKEKANYTFLDKGVVDGKQYELPFFVGASRVMFYNKDILAKAGVTSVPKTWTQFEAASKKIIAAGYEPLTGGWGEPTIGEVASVFDPYLFQAGGTLFNSKGTATAFDSKAGVAAATFLYNLKKTGALSSSITSLTAAQAQTEFTSGRAAFYVSSDSNYAPFSQNGFKLGVEYSLKDKEQGTLVADGEMIMFKECPSYSLCAKLTNYVDSAKVETDFNNKLEKAPPIDKDQKSEIPSVFTDLYSKDANILHFFGTVPGSNQVVVDLWQNLQQMMEGEKTPAQAMKDAATAGNAAIKAGDN